MAVIKERKGTGKNRALKNITINYPKAYDDKILELIGSGLVASRSEAIRIAVREYLHREYEALEILGIDLLKRDDYNSDSEYKEQCFLQELQIAGDERD